VPGALQNQLPIMNLSCAAECVVNFFVVMFCINPSDSRVLDRKYKKALIVVSFPVLFVELHLAISAGYIFCFFSPRFAIAGHVVNLVELAAERHLISSCKDGKEWNSDTKLKLMTYN
jgi:hypothetical protein